MTSATRNCYCVKKIAGWKLHDWETSAHMLKGAAVHFFFLTCKNNLKCAEMKRMYEVAEKSHAEICKPRRLVCVRTRLLSVTSTGQCRSCGWSFVNIGGKRGGVSEGE